MLVLCFGWFTLKMKYIGNCKAQFWRCNNLNVTRQGFPQVVYTWEGGQVQGDKTLMRGLMRGDIDLMGGPYFDRLYHKLEVLLFNYMMQLVGYESIKTHWFVSYRFQIRTITKESGQWIASCNCSHMDPTLVISIVVALIFQ